MFFELSDNIPDEKKLKRFLHYGSIYGTYKPGSRLHPSYFDEGKVELLQAVLKNMEKGKIFDIIKEVYKENTSPHPEMIPFVLAECARIESLKLDALKTAEILCDNTKLFLLFFKFGLERKPKIGTGPACKRLIASYYLNKDVIELAGEVSQIVGYRHWRHTDLMRIGHLKAKPDDIARQAVFAYISYGVGTMNKNFSDKPEAKTVVDHINTVDKFRKEKDPAKVVEIINSYMLTLDHLNSSLLKNKQVWAALLRRISLSTLLDKLNFIARNRLFREHKSWQSEFITNVKDSMQNNEAIKDSGLHPSRVYLEYINYQNAAKFKLEMATKKLGKPEQKPPALSSDITLALTQLMNATFKLFKPTNLRYLICVDPGELNTRKCGYVPYMLPCQGAAITIQTYLKIEPNVTVVWPTEDGSILQIDVSKGMTSKELEEKLSNFPGHLILPSVSSKPVYPTWKVFEWAHKQKKKFDCFILIGTSLSVYPYLAKFAQYQKSMKLPRSKLVLFSLCRSKMTVDQKDVFVVSGFDGKVLPLISSFVKEVF